MKRYLLYFLLFVSKGVVGQTDFPELIVGTWKIEHEDAFERWDRLQEGHLKGIAYILREEGMHVTEYLELTEEKNKVSYVATVPGHNNGASIPFTMTKKGAAYLFENPEHDFPKQISYLSLSEDELMVTLSDGQQKTHSYKLIRQIEKAVTTDSAISNPNYDQILATQLGADDYGMKKYVLVILKTGINKTEDKEFINRCFRGHMDNITRMVADGKLIIAGPVGANDKSYRGIFIFALESMEEVTDLLQSDAAIHEKLLDVELYPWYGSAALPVYLDASDKIWKVKP